MQKNRIHRSATEYTEIFQFKLLPLRSQRLRGEPSEAFGFFVMHNVAACTLLFFLVLGDPLVDLVAKFLGDFLGNPIVGDFFKAHFAVGELPGQLE